MRIAEGCVTEVGVYYGHGKTKGSLVRTMSFGLTAQHTMGAMQHFGASLEALNGSVMVTTEDSVRGMDEARAETNQKPQQERKSLNFLQHRDRVGTRLVTGETGHLNEATYHR